MAPRVLKEMKLNSRITFLLGKHMKPEDCDVVLAELDPSPVNTTPAKQNRSVVEQLLSPQSLQWMMACGSGLLMLGFVIWLWTVGIFENPLVIAGCSGAATLAVLAGGISMVRMTRYQLAGKWLTLLGALALPLNLWLYDAQGLVTLAEGGHLWIPAAICCFLYAGIARVLRDATFVYTLVAGIVMTGLLFLADHTVGRFFELLPPATFLLSIGWISVFAERFFVDNDGDFSRKKFGMAFQRSGMLVITAGLLLLFGGYFAAIFSFLLDGLIPSPIINQGQKVWALGLILTSAIGFGIQGLVQKYHNYHVAGFALLVAAIPMTLNIFAVPITFTSVATFAAAITITFNATVALIQARTISEASIVSPASMMTGSKVIVGLLSALSLTQIATHLLGFAELQIAAPATWWTALQILLTTIASWSLAWNCNQAAINEGREDAQSRFFFIVGGAMLVLSVWTGGWMQQLLSAQVFAFVAIAVPAAMSIAGRFLQDKRTKMTARIAGSAMITSHLVLLGASELLHLTAMPGSQVLWIVSLAIAAIIYWLGSLDDAISIDRFLSYASAAAATALVADLLGLNTGYGLVLAPMLVGTAIKIVDSVWLKKERTIGNLFVIGSGVASVLLAMSRWLEGSADGPLLFVMGAMLACTTLVSFLTKDDYWRTAFRALIVAIIGSSVCVFDGFLNMNGWHRAELCSMLVGVALLVMGHVAWSREKEGEEDDVATASLIMGGLLFAVPMVVGLVLYRTGASPDTQWRLFHEVGAIVGSLALLGSGLLCRLRITTVTGASILAAYVVSLATLIRWPSQLQNVSVVMMIGGGLFFGTALLMSIYRDRLVSLPRKVRDGEGLFKVLKWR